MAVSDISENRQDLNAWKRVPRHLSRYDLLLTAIPILFAAALLASVLAPITLHVAVGGGAVVSAALMMDALYFHPPTAASDTVDETELAETTDTVAGVSGQ